MFKTLSSVIHTVPGKTVQVLSDNVTMCAYINRMGRQTVQRNLVLQQLFLLCLRHKVTLSAKFLRGKHNVLADDLSRQSSPYEWQLSQGLFRKLYNMWGPFTINQFASQRTAQVRLYNSFFMDPGSAGVDALVQTDWSQHMNFVNPPFFLIMRALQHILVQRAEAVIIVPQWHGQEWTQLLRIMAVDRPMTLLPQLCIVPRSLHVSEPL